MNCPHCAGSARFAGFVTRPPKSIYQCDGCHRFEWTDGLPWQHQSNLQPAPEQQPQAKLEPEE
jgi:hypothetical protein